jgi:Domain of unknown function (DUF1737)
MEYAIVEGHTTTELLKEVVEWIARGWKPQGGIAVLTYGGPTRFFQAMIRNP